MKSGEQCPVPVLQYAGEFAELLNLLLTHRTPEPLLPGHVQCPRSLVQPLVSCIMPTANRRRFVPQAIRYFLRAGLSEQGADYCR